MSRHKQRGVVLLVSLLLLLMLTVIAITAANQSSLQLRISSNSQQQNAAFQAAESGLKQWTDAYFANTNDPKFFPDDLVNISVGDPDESIQRFSVTKIYGNSAVSYGMRLDGTSHNLYTFDIRSTGEVCEAGSCTSIAVLRQGGQRRD